MKKILALLLAVVMVMSMAACATSDPANNNGNNSNTTTGTESTGPKEYTIKVWTPAEDQAEGNNWLVKMEEAFAAAHPEYKITWTNESMSEGNAAGTVAGDVTASADVYMFANDQLGTLITAGGLSQLGGSFLEQVKNDNSEFMISTVTHTDNGVYGFPVTNNTWFTYYNTDVFTAEDVKSLDTMLTKGKVSFPFNTGWNAGCFFLATGGTVFGPKGIDAEAGIQFGGENGYKAAKKMVEVCANSNLIAADQTVGGLVSGEVDACFSGSWDASKVKEALGDKMGVAQIPTVTIDGEEYQLKALGGTKCVGVNPNSGATDKTKQKVATQFAAFLASADAQLERYNMRGIIPAAKSLLNNETIQKDPVAVAEINTMANCTVIQSALPEMGNYWTPVQTFGTNCGTGDINMDNYKQAVDKLMEQLNAESLG